MEGRRTRHTVTVDQKELERLAGAGASPEALVRRTFEFLLEREPPEQILPRFRLADVGRYFPEFEEVVGKR